MARHPTVSASHPPTRGPAADVTPDRPVQNPRAAPLIPLVDAAPHQREAERDQQRRGEPLEGPGQGERQDAGSQRAEQRRAGESHDAHLEHPLASEAIARGSPPPAGTRTGSAGTHRASTAGRPRSAWRLRPRVGQGRRSPPSSPGTPSPSPRRTRAGCRGPGRSGGGPSPGLPRGGSGGLSERPPSPSPSNAASIPRATVPPQEARPPGAGWCRRGRMPVRMGCPNPPAPTRAPSVAVPTAMTAEVLTPARMEGEASGSSTRRSRNIDGRPSASADSRRSGEMPTRPAWVFRTMGRSP
jgi:hypothetical protein